MYVWILKEYKKKHKRMLRIQKNKQNEKTMSFKNNLLKKKK